jgi:hypothetical protein
VRTVARYAVALVAAEQPGATPYLLSEVRQLEDRLGLNAVAMRRLMWEVTDSAGNVLEEGERVAARWPAWTPTASGRGERRAEVSRALGPKGRARSDKLQNGRPDGRIVLVLLGDCLSSTERKV